MSLQSATDPDWWEPSGHRAPGVAHPPVGSMIGWRYAAWTVLEVWLCGDVDLNETDRAALDGCKPEFRDRNRPYTIVLRHEFGPLLWTGGVHTLHDGARTIHLGYPARAHKRWQVLSDRYPLCVCCGHLWPCLEHDRDLAAAQEAEVMARKLDGAQPGVCASCAEPITARQKTITFPEPSLIVPGAPPPVFHLRGGCAYAAAQYEVELRLPAYPGAGRLATCTGTLFAHANGNLPDCSAGLLCTGHHGPPAVRSNWHRCYTRTYHFGGLRGDGYPRPTTDCGYRDPEHPRLVCLGGERNGSPPTASDLSAWAFPEAGGGPERLR